MTRGVYIVPGAEDRITVAAVDSRGRERARAVAYPDDPKGTVRAVVAMLRALLDTIHGTRPRLIVLRGGADS